MSSCQLLLTSAYFELILFPLPVFDKSRTERWTHRDNIIVKKCIVIAMPFAKKFFGKTRFEIYGQCVETITIWLKSIGDSRYFFDHEIRLSIYTLIDLNIIESFPNVKMTSTLRSSLMFTNRNGELENIFFEDYRKSIMRLLSSQIDPPLCFPYMASIRFHNERLKFVYLYNIDVGINNIVGTHICNVCTLFKIYHEVQLFNDQWRNCDSSKEYSQFQV